MEKGSQLHIGLMEFKEIDLVEKRISGLSLAQKNVEDDEKLKMGRGSALR